MDRFVMRFLLVRALVVAAPLEPSTRTWPLLSGHHALAQSTAPAAGGPDQMAPSDAADDDASDPTATDTVHDAIAGGVTGTGAWLDSFFGTAHDQAENNKSRVRVSFGGFVEEGSDLGQRLQVKARLALPHTGKRLSLLVGGDGDDDLDLQNTADDEVAATNAARSKEQRARTGRANQTMAPALFRDRNAPPGSIPRPFAQGQGSGAIPKTGPSIPAFGAGSRPPHDKTSGLAHSKESCLGFPFGLQHASLRHAHWNIFHGFDGCPRALGRAWTRCGN